MAALQRIFQVGKSEVPVLRSALRVFSSEGPGKGKSGEPAAPAPPKAAPSPPPPKAAAPPPPAASVYQSAATPASPSAPVGPGADKGGPYPNTEYFCYNKLSYYDLESEMKADRIAQPGANNGHF